ncbi:MAG: hypothetical protein WBW93_04395 [Steroidobacteraceae bacterium]
MEVAAQDVKLARKCSEYSAQIAEHLFRLQTSLDELRDPDSTRFHDHEAAVQALCPLGKEFHDFVGER